MKPSVRCALALGLTLNLRIFCCAENMPEPVVSTVLNDTKNIVTSPLRLKSEDMPAVFGVSAVVLATTLFDEPIQRHLFPSRNNDPSADLRALGDKGQLLGPAVGTLFAVQGVLADSAKSKETAFLSYESFALAGLTESVLKFAVGRARPSKTDDAFDFKAASGDSSFPSGHTTVAFAAATVFSEQYPSWMVIIPSYGIASAIGFSRLYANQHWSSDVMAGAILGVTVGHSLRIWHLRSRKHPNQTLEMDMNGLRWVSKF
jgi:membrane-associated phospholipid phosphatase